MKYSKSTIDIFFSLLRAGLWGQSVRLLPYEPIDFDAVYQLAEEQSVEGLIAAGLEHVEDRKVVKQEALPFMKKVFSLEGRNDSMNHFIAELMGKMSDAGIYSLLVKGQGIAQCYERPEWRAAGDVDLLLDLDNYRKAKALLTPLASYIGKEYIDRMHLEMTVENWTVELHGSFRSNRLGRVNRCINAVQDDIFQNGHVRVWKNGETDVFLPSADNDIILIFTHILQHFFAGGIGLRQICDWCRLLWTFREEIDRRLLVSRLESVRLMSEWEVFGNLAVKYLGMPLEALPFYRESVSLDRKTCRLLNHILRTGNFGHNQGIDYLQKVSYPKRKLISFWRVTENTFFRLFIFPADAAEFYVRYVFSGFLLYHKGKSNSVL